MFGGLRQGSLLYMLTKTNDGAELKIGTVDNISNPAPKYGQNMYGQQEMCVDVRVKYNEELIELKQLQTHLNVMTQSNLVVSDSKEAMSAEVEAMQRTSRQILDSIPYHESVIEQCDVMLRELNPQFAKEKEQEEKIGVLESKMSNIEGTLVDIQTMLSTALSASKKTKKEE